MYKIKHSSSIILVWSVFFLFAISTFTKINFSAAIAYFVKENIFTKTNSGTIVAAFYLVYGLGQILGANYMNKISPYKIVCGGLLLSILANIALCRFKDFNSVLILWSINGLAHCVMWPTAVRVASEYVGNGEKRFAKKMLTLSVAIGGISSYLSTSPVLERFGWIGMFVTNITTMVLMLIFWIFVNIKTGRVISLKLDTVTEDKTASESGVKLGRVLWQSGVCYILLIVTIRAILDNGLKTWMPTMMMESYDLSTTWSGILTAVIYLCNIAAVFILTPIVSRVKNEVKRYIALFSVIIPFIVVMVWVGDVPMLIITLSFVVVSCLSYFMNDFSVSIPGRFTEKGLNCSGSIASLLNGFGSMGVLAASACFGYIAENFNWQAVIFCCIGLAALALILAVVASFIWEKFIKEN